MNDIDRWFERTARRTRPTASLNASLLTGRIFAYFRYRLRYALSLDTVRFVVHVLEFLIILSSLGGLAAFVVIFLRIGSLLVGGGWWGLLEVMRERLRGFSQAGERDLAEREIGRWLALSVIVASALTIVVGGVLALFRPLGHDPAGHVFAFLVVLEIGLRFPVGVLHSGMYATRRVYRPTWSLIAPTAVQLVLLSAGFQLFPTAAIIGAIIASNAIGIWVTVHYTLGLYRLVGLWPKRGGRASSPRRLVPRIPIKLGLKATLAGLGLRLDSLVLLAILGIYGTDNRVFDLTAGFLAWQHIDAFEFFYMVLPLFNGSYRSTRLFYFDFVRLRRAPALAEFRRLYFRKLLWAIPVLALFYWSLAAALGLSVLEGIPIGFLLALLPLFVLRAFIGIYQVRLFAEGHFRTLIASLVFFGALLSFAWMDPNPASDLLEITAAMLTLLIVLINVQHFRDRRSTLPTLLPLKDWMRGLAQEPGRVAVGEIAIPEWIPSRQRSAAMRLIEQTLGGEGHFAFRSRAKLVYYQRTSSDRSARQPLLALQALTGGAANRGRVLDAPMSNGRDAFDRFIAEHWIQATDGTVARPDGSEALCSDFRRIFDGGIVFDVQTLEGTRDMRNLEHGLLARAIPTAMKSLEGSAVVVPLSGRWLTPIFDEGELRLLLVMPPDPEPAQVEHWSRIVRARRFALGTLETAGPVRND